MKWNAIYTILLSIAINGCSNYYEISSIDGGNLDESFINLDSSDPTSSNEGYLPPGFYQLGCQWDSPFCGPTPGTFNPTINPIRE